MDDTYPKAVCTQTESSWVRLNVLLSNAEKTNPEHTHFNGFVVWYLAIKSWLIHLKIFHCVTIFPCFTFRVKESNLGCLR